MFRTALRPVRRAHCAGVQAVVAAGLIQGAWCATVSAPAPPTPLPVDSSPQAAPPPIPLTGPAEEAPVQTFYIRQFRVRGASKLPRVDIEGAVYRFMGPECTPSHVEGARTALEKAYRDKGYQTVTVSMPAQVVQNGIVYLVVTEGKIGRLRVMGSRYFDLSKIKAKAPSLAEGTVPNFNDVQRDMLALNRHPDRQITPKMVPGAVPGTFDVDLNVKDKSPLHGSLELNNRYSPDTTELRLNGAISYSNLWQAGHTMGLSFQIAPERLKDAEVYAAFYTMPVESVDGLSLTFSGTKQDSDISTLGGSAVAGRGYMMGVRATKTLPPGKGYYHTFSGGFLAVLLPALNSCAPRSTSPGECDLEVARAWRLPSVRRDPLRKPRQLRTADCKLVALDHDTKRRFAR